MKTCADCERSLPLAAFSPRKQSPDGRARYCRECFRVRSKASYRKRQAERGRVVREPEVLPEGYKRCPDCGEVKQLEDFPRNRRTVSGFAIYCKPCHNARGEETRQRLYGGGRQYHLRARYGIDQAEFDRILKLQNGLCAACDKPDPEHVDHDHVTGEVRGILCFNCNQALGNVRDQQVVLFRLISYLQAARQAPLMERVAAFEAERRPRVFIHQLPPDLVIELEVAGHASRP